VQTLVADVTFAAVLATSVAARAQTQLSVAPSVSVSSVSDDNVFTTAMRSADYLTLLTPGVEGTVKSTRASLLGFYSFDMLRAADFSALNNFEARRHALFDASYRETARLSTELNGRYDRSDEAGDLNFETALLLPRTRATRWELAPSFSYRANSVMTVQGQYDWVQESLESVMVEDEHVGRFFVSRQLSQRASIGAGYVGRVFVDDAGTQTSNAAIVGPTYELAPFTMLTIQAGPRQSSKTGLEPEVVASLVRRAPNLFGYAVDYWRGEAIVLGVLGPVEATSATARAIWPVRRDVAIEAGTGYFKSDSLFQGHAHTYHAKAVVSWQLKPFYTIAGSYATDFQHGDIRTSLLNGQNLVRNVFQVSLTIAPRSHVTIRRPTPVEPLSGVPKGGQS